MREEKKLDVILCPFQEVIIQRVNSDLLEKIGGLPLLILLQIGQRKSIIEIADGICMPSWVVRDAADELVQNGLLENLGQQEYTLTTVGESYIHIYAFIEAFNENRERRYAVNLFTCQLEQIRDERCFANTKRPGKDARQLPNKLQNAAYMISTLNFENTLEYMKQYLDLSDIALTEDDYEFIQFQLKAIGEVFYVPYAVPVDAYYETDSNDEKGDDDDRIRRTVWLSVPLIEGKQIYEYAGVSAEISEALLKMHVLAPEYLNRDGKKQIEKIKHAESYTQESPLILIDAYGGRKYKIDNSESATSSLPFHIHPITLSARYSFPTERKQAKITGGDFYYRYEVTKAYSVPVKVEFSKLIQSEVDAL